MNQNIYQETLWKSDHNLKTMTSRRIRRWDSSNQLPNSATKTFWQLTSNVKYEKFLECKKMELFYLGLPEEMQQCLFDAPGTLDDELFVDLIRAKALYSSSNFSKTLEFLQRRLTVLQILLGRPVWNLNLLYTYKGDLKYEIALERAAIRKVEKFSGWVRNSSAVGSKRKSGLQVYEPEICGAILDEKLDYFDFLTGSIVDYSFPEVTGNKLYSLDRKIYHSFLVLKFPELGNVSI